MDGLIEMDVVCAYPVCQSDNPPRGGKDKVNLWTAGHNIVEGVYTQDIEVYNGQYIEPCSADDGRIFWQADDDLFTHFDVTEIFEYEPRDPITVEFDWDGCFSPPDIDCSEFLVEEWGIDWTPVNVNNGEGVSVNSKSAY